MGARKVEATLTQCLFATVARLNAELTTLIVITIGKATRPRSGRRKLVSGKNVSMMLDST